MWTSAFKQAESEPQFNSLADSYGQIEAKIQFYLWFCTAHGTSLQASNKAQDLSITQTFASLVPMHDK